MIKSVKIFSPDPLEALVCLCDLAAHEIQEGHLHQACHAVLGLLSLPLSQGCCRKLSLPFVLEGLDIQFHQ